MLSFRMSVGKRLLPCYALYYTFSADLTFYLFDSSLTIFIEDNQSGSEVTKVQKIALYGST